MFVWCSYVNKTTWCYQYKYLGYGIWFDRKGYFSNSPGGTGKNLIIFGVDVSSTTKIDSRKKDILILGKGPK